MPFGDINLSTLAQVIAWWHQAIIRTNVDFSPQVLCGIHLRATSQESLINLNCNICLEITLLKSQPHLLGANELILLTEHRIRMFRDVTKYMLHMSLIHQDIESNQEVLFTAFFEGDKWLANAVNKQLNVSNNRQLKVDV